MSTSTNVNIKSPNFSCMSSTALEMHPYQYHIDACYTPTTTPTISPPSSTPRATAKPPNLRLSPHGPYIYILSYAYEYINQQHNSLPISHTLCNATATAQYKPKQLGYTILGWVLSCDATKFISHKVLTFWHSSHVCVCARGCVLLFGYVFGFKPRHIGNSGCHFCIPNILHASSGAPISKLRNVCNRKASAQHATPPWIIGCSMPSMFVKAVRNGMAAMNVYISLIFYVNQRRHYHPWPWAHGMIYCAQFTCISGCQLSCVPALNFRYQLAASRRTF